ncbi:hypothetical protein [Streptomyces sp. NPDC015131]|uniref:hypothetical protein n=1 Tax=Streptomyces sp. NPDC015131 TaxID=3364941 RepID=UPI0036FC20EA
METNGETIRPTAEQALAALAATEEVRTSTTALSATPWPRWFAVALTVYIAAIPPLYGGTLAEPAWLMPRAAWSIALVATTGSYLALFAVAAANWRRKTGVALRFDVLPKRVTLPLATGLPAILLGSALVFRSTGEPLWLFAASAIGAAVSVGFHLTFVRLHRRAS